MLQTSVVLVGSGLLWTREWSVAWWGWMLRSHVRRRGWTLPMLLACGAEGCHLGWLSLHRGTQAPRAAAVALLLPAELAPAMMRALALCARRWGARWWLPIGLGLATAS